MAKRPDLLLLDEPMANLDPLARTRLLQALMGTVAERGTTLLLSSHIISELEPICDYLVILSSSTVQVAAPIAELLAGHRLLVGPADQDVPPGAEVVTTTRSEREATLLVRVPTPLPGPQWRDLQPSLEEIVLGYLSYPGARTCAGGASPVPGGAA
jgi:ABC-2 type transport system ATP-binding protein